MLALSGHLGFFVVQAAPRNLFEQLWATSGSKGNNPECFNWGSGNGGGRNWVIKKD